MATKIEPILGWQSKPDASGNALFEMAHLNFGANDLARQMVFRLGAVGAAPTTKFGVYGAFLVPQDYVGTPVLGIVWASVQTTNAVVFDFDYRAIAVSESLDPSTWQESLTTTSTVSGTARNRVAASMSLTAANLAAGDLVEFFFGRDGTDGADTLADPAYVFDLYLQYADV